MYPDFSPILSNPTYQVHDIHYPEGFKGGFLNATSLKKHIQCIRQDLQNDPSDPSYHIFGVAETRLGPKIDEHLVNIHGFNVVVMVYYYTFRIISRLRYYIHLRQHKKGNL